MAYPTGRFNMASYARFGNRAIILARLGNQAGRPATKTMTSRNLRDKSTRSRRRCWIRSVGDKFQTPVAIDRLCVEVVFKSFRRQPIQGEDLAYLPAEAPEYSVLASSRLMLSERSRSKISSVWARWTNRCK